MKNRNIIKSIMILLIALIYLESAFAAPAQLGIAIKDETKECRGYWPGDEYVAYKLHPDWKAYFPNDNGTISIEYGSCEFRRSLGASSKGEEEKCCKTLGLTYVIKENIDSVSYPYISFLIIGSIVILISLIIIGLIIFFILRKILNKPKSKKRKN